MKKIILITFCAVFCFALTSCNKDEVGKYNPKKKIQKVYRDETSGTKSLSEVWHWDDNQLTQVDYYDDGEIGWKELYVYNSDGRLAKVIDPEWGEYTEFIYDGKLLKSINYYDSGDGIYCNFFYENDKLTKAEVAITDYGYIEDDKHKTNPLKNFLPINVKEIVKQMAVISRKTERGTYDGKLSYEFTWEGKNISKVNAVCYDPNDPEDNEYVTVTYTYDDKINPLKNRLNLYSWAFADFEEPATFFGNANNPTKEVYTYEYDGDIETTIINYSYEYDGKYPVKVSKSGEEDNEVLYYEYK